jgi:HK97 gp10 family phage protein
VGVDFGVRKMSTDIKVDSVELQEYINKVIEELGHAPEITQKQLEKGMELAKSLAQLYAPVDTGRLRDNIHLEKSSENAIAIVANPRNLYGKAYAAYPEHGTSLQDEQSYIRLALKEVLPEMITGTVNEFLKVFEKKFVSSGGKITK